MLHPFSKLQRAGTAARQHSADGDQEPRVDSARFVGRVARAFHTAQERGGTLQLRLSPPELGSLRLELVVKDGILAASLEAETPAARRVLLDHLPALRDRLAEQSIRIERFDVDVRRDGGSNQAQSGPHQHRDPSSPQAPPRNPSPNAQRAPATAQAAQVPGARRGDTQINLVA
jgi:flagellar hook-length control protein FliK